MILPENKYTNISSTFPNAIMIDASGAGLTDGSEFAALPLNDGWEPFSQAFMSYASGVQLQNIPTGSVGVPNGVADAVGVSQMLEAIQKSIGNGPGNYTLWANELDPSVTGDRILLLAEQGVLVAVYPGIDAANWIGGNTAAQVAAEAAGQKFYRSSDAGGAVGDAAGPYIQLPPQNPTFLKQYSEAGGYFIITGPTGWSTTRAVLIPYQESGGAWWLIFSIAGTYTSSTNADMSISGVTFKAGQNQTISLGNNDTANEVRGERAISGTGDLTLRFASVGAILSVTGNVELNAKPTWADDFTYQWGIRY